MTDDVRATLTRWHALFQTDASWVPPEHLELWSALRSLEPGARDALLISSLDGLSVARIADLLDEAAGTTAYWISSARQRLAPLTPNLRDDLVALETAAPAMAPVARGGRISPIVWLGVPVTIALVVAMIGAAQLVKTPAEPGVGGNLSPGATASVPTVTTIEWSEVRFAKDGRIQQMVVANGRVVAIGLGRRAPAAWYSDDGGKTWETASMDGKPPTESSVASFQSLAASGNTLVAVGEWQTPNAANAEPKWWSWVSTDLGATWHVASRPQDGVAFDVAPTEDGFLVAGQDLGRGAMQLWTSSDGARWQSVAPIGFPQFGASVTDIARFNGGYIGVGVNFGGSRPRLAMWSSTDARRWSPIEGAPVDEGSMRQIVADANGVMALGILFGRADGSDARATLWHSSDGSAWQPIQLDEQRAQPISIATGPLGTVIVGASDDGARAWFLPVSMDHVARGQIDDIVQVVVALPDRFVAAGGCADAACTRSKVVVGLPATSSPGPAP